MSICYIKPQKDILECSEVDVIWRSRYKQFHTLLSLTFLAHGVVEAEKQLFEAERWTNYMYSEEESEQAEGIATEKQ